MRSHNAKSPCDREHSHIGWHRIVFAFGIRPVFRSSATFSVDLESERVCPLAGGNLCPLATAGTAPASGFISLAAKLPFCAPSRVFSTYYSPMFLSAIKEEKGLQLLTVNMTIFWIWLLSKGRMLGWLLKC